MPPPHQPDPSADQVADVLAEECLAMRLRLLSRVIVGAYDSALRPLNLTSSQISMLAVLTKGGAMPQSRLGEILRIEKSTLSRNVQRMAQRGWVEESSSPDHGGRLLSTSRKGRRILERAHPLWQEAQDEAVARLGPKATQALKTVAARLRDSD